MNRLLQTAIAYRRAGFSVIPIKPRDKKPLVTWEPFQKEPASEETIKFWFEQWPDANLAIVTGEYPVAWSSTSITQRPRINLSRYLVAIFRPSREPAPAKVGIFTSNIPG
jgi:hypothetical protein